MTLLNGSPASRREDAGLGLVDALFLLFVFWFGSNAAQWIFSQGGPPPVLSYIAFLAFTSVVIGVSGAFHQPLLTAPAREQTTSIWIWITGYTAFIIFNYLYSSQSDEATQTLITSLEMVMIFAIVLYFFTHENIRQRIGQLFALLAAGGALINIYDFINPTFSEVFGRAAGLYINPNASGFYLICAMTCSLPVLSQPLRWALLVLVSIGVFLTFSRSAWLVLSVSVILLVWGGHIGGRQLRSLLGLGAITLLALLAYSVVSGALYELLVSVGMSDLLDENTRQRLGLISFATDHSANERQRVALLAVQEFANSNTLLLGNGLGFTREWDFRVGTHNMYLLFLAEGGLLGFVLYCAFVWILWRHTGTLGRIVVAQVAIYGLFSHNILTSPETLIVLAAIASGAVGMDDSNWSTETEHSADGADTSRHNGSVGWRSRTHSA